MMHAYFLGGLALSCLLLAASAVIEIVRGVDPVPVPPEFSPVARRFLPYLLPLFWCVMAVVFAIFALSYARDTTAHPDPLGVSWVRVIVGMLFIFSGVFAIVRSLRKQPRPRANPPQSQLNDSHAGQ